MGRLIASTRHGALDYPRHFMMLAGIAGVLVVTGLWRQSLGAVESFGLYGALHSSTIVLTLRGARALPRKAAFVAIAAAFSMLSVYAGFFASRLIGTLSGVTPALLLSACSGLGAASYALLIRRFWINDLSLRTLLWMTLCCVVATLAVLTAVTFLHAGSALWFAIAWWFAFSGALCRLGPHASKRD